MVLCLNCFRKEHTVIYIVVAGDFAAVVSVEFYNLWEIIIYSIKFKVLFPTPFDCFRQSFPSTAGPEDQLVAILFPFPEICYESFVWLTKLRPLAEAECSVKIYGNRLEIDWVVILYSYHLLCLLLGEYNYPFFVLSSHLYSNNWSTEREK